MNSKMNIVFISNMTTSEKLQRELPQLFGSGFDVKFYTLDTAEEEICTQRDTDILVVDAMGTVSEAMLQAMPALKLIQSEGVGYQGFDLAAAKRRGIPVCNNRGINDTAVAEQTLLLMLGCLKNARNLDTAVRAGRQIEAKKACFGKLRELSECTVGLIGFGDIARKTAGFLKPFGAHVLVANRTQYPQLEAEYSVVFTDLDTLLAESDIVSLHLPVNADTAGFADAAFFAKMKQGAIFINTARGELVENTALYDALCSGRLSMAGLDVIAPEPVTADNLLLKAELADKLLFSPHIGGLSSLTVKKLYSGIWENIQHIQNSEPPVHSI